MSPASAPWATPPDGWCSVEHLTRYAFAQARVVMANEAHDGLARCVRTREVGVRMVQAAHEAGVRRLAMEALPHPADGTLGPIRVIPAAQGGYLAQPEMRTLIGTALELGWTLWAYEAAIPRDADPEELVSLPFTNKREREQAENLCRLAADAPAAPLLAWCGNSHACKEARGDWVPMGHHFTMLSGAAAFVIDQTVTVDFSGQSAPWVQELLSGIGEQLDAFGGTAGILREQAPPRLGTWPGVDAVVVSTDNALT
jgi:hypothetical protein